MSPCIIHIYCTKQFHSTMSTNKLLLWHILGLMTNVVCTYHMNRWDVISFIYAINTCFQIILIIPKYKQIIYGNILVCHICSICPQHRYIAIIFPGMKSSLLSLLWPWTWSSLLLLHDHIPDHCAGSPPRCGHCPHRPAGQTTGTAEDWILLRVRCGRGHVLCGCGAGTG